MKKSMRLRSGRSVLVTGAGGFIGSHLCDTLLMLGHRVTGVDCFTDYYRRSTKERNLAQAAQSPSFRLIEADLIEADLHQLLEGIEVIYHLAGQPGVRGSWGDQFEVYARNNILATQRLLEASLAKGRVPVIYASSSSAYGDQKVMPLVEAAAPAPRSPYGMTKLGAEHLCQLYSQVHNLPTVSLRLFTVYGPRQRPDMAFQRFLTAAAAGKEITMYGDGTQTRDFTYVGDVVAAFVAAGEACVSGRVPAPVMNVAGGSRASMLDVLAAVSAVLPGQIRVRHMPAQPGDVRDTWADTTLAASVLGFEPRTGLPEGLERQWQAVRREQAYEQGSYSSSPIASRYGIRRHLPPAGRSASVLPSQQDLGCAGG
jgi:nucleoside-diphosphate-sugar epimerase